MTSSKREKIARIIEEVTRQAMALLESESFMQENRYEETQFTRKRKLGFANCVVLILLRLTKSVQVELMRYFEKLGSGVEAPTEQAFSKARQQIRPEAFEQLFELTRDTLVKRRGLRKYKGYRVFGIDGSDTVLPNSNELWTAFPDLGKEQHRVPHGRMSVMYELLDGYAIDGYLVSRDVGERELAMWHVEACEEMLTARDIVMFDRGYPQHLLIRWLNRKKAKFVMRVASSFSAAIDQCTSDDMDITLGHEGERYTVRVVRVTLDTGEVETLITNLSRKAFKREEFLALYALRWGAEKGYDRVKNKLSLEKFSGKTLISVRQEFYGMLFVLNYATMIWAEGNETLAQQRAHKHNLHDYIVNYNVLVHELKDKLPALLNARSQRTRNDILALIKHNATKHPCPVRPDRHPPRPEPSHRRAPSLSRSAL